MISVMLKDFFRRKKEGKVNFYIYLRCYHMHGTPEVALKAYLHRRHQHCTDEAQKAETSVSAVGYVYIDR